MLDAVHSYLTFFLVFLKEKEWLCLNCQVKRAAAGTEPQKETLLADSFKKTTATSPGPERTSAPGSPQKKESTVAAKQVKTEGPVSQRQDVQAPGQKTPQQSQRIDPQKQTGQTIKPPQKTGSATTQESGGLFGFSAPKSQSDAAKPAESVTGKMFGFGTSIFSSASTLITSAVQDDPKTTAPVSPKLSPAKDPKSLTVKKQEQEKKPQQVQQTPGPTPVQPKADKLPSELPKKESASPLISRISDSTCPLCKVKLNVGTKDPPNYSTCTECKIVVCNQCGFNPTPNQTSHSPLLQAKVNKDVISSDSQKTDHSTCPLCKTELNIASKDPPNYKKCTDCKTTVCNQCGFNPMPNVKEWLCLNCQMQRALSASDVTGPSIKPETETNKGSSLTVRQKIPPPKQEESLKKELSDKKIEAPLTDSSKKERSSTPASPQRTQHAVVPPAAKEPEVKIQPSPSTGQSPPTDQRVTSTQRQTGQESECDPKYMKVKPEESEKTTLSKDTKTVSEASKTTESLGGKMFGFGSSIFSSASNLISAAESRTTPPGSRKMSAPPQLSGKMSVSPKISPKSTPTVSPKMSPAREPKVLSAKPGESQLKKEDKALSVSPRCSDGGPTICPLCKGEMNIGSKQTPNYNTCTECKTTVCNQCGFNPMPMGEVSTEAKLLL
uniref:Zinc finger piccolo-type domain-containing protein n=1 Tax=Poecilia mexicana TaxID=48701 RepID=A0A3B3WCG2_9TELE